MLKNRTIQYIYKKKAFKKNIQCSFNIIVRQLKCFDKLLSNKEVTKIF